MTTTQGEPMTSVITSLCPFCQEALLCWSETVQYASEELENWHSVGFEEKTYYVACWRVNI